jgi:antitoxin ParD1/3/4
LTCHQSGGTGYPRVGNMGRVRCAIFGGISRIGRSQDHVDFSDFDNGR